MRSVEFEVDQSWDGDALRLEDRSRIRAWIDASESVLVLNVDARFHDDPAPPGPPGRTDRLWDFEVVEFFLLGRAENYLEIELGPHGHSLGLVLAGRRRVVETQVPIAFHAERKARRWTGEARIGLEWLPTGIRAANAYAIHGTGESRRYLAANPVPGEKPDFHRLECFVPCVLEARVE